MGRASGENLSSVKTKNKQMVKEVIYKYSPISRAEIAEKISLTPPTISNIVTEMIESDYVVELLNSDKVSGGVGRKPIHIDFLKEAFYFFGIEIAPANIFFYLCDLRGNNVFSKRVKIKDRQYETILEQVKLLIENGIDTLKTYNIDFSKFMGICIAVPGYVDNKEGIIRRSERFNWNDKKIADDLTRILKANYPIIIENNVKARAIGEDVFSKDVLPDTFIYFFVSKGIASPMIIKNNSIIGNVQGDGEMGHFVMQLDGPVCKTCGNNGCLEAFASEDSLINMCEKTLKVKSDSLLHNYLNENNEVTLDGILKAVEDKDRMTTSIVNISIRYLAIALANIMNFVTPQLAIVDAYIMVSEDNRKYFLQEIKKNLFGYGSEEILVEFKEPNSFRGAKGAAAVAIKTFFIEK